MALYIETPKPASLSEATETLYYMYSNSHDNKDRLPRYKKVTADEVLEVAYKVYTKLQDDVNKLEE